MVAFVITAGVLCLAVASLVLILSIECLAAAFTGRPAPRAAEGGARPRTVVLVPAHDEEDILARALDSVRPQLGPEDRTLVVAHNCTDGTAELARSKGAEVLEVRDAGTGGKPDALKAGLRALDADPPEVVAIIDADCRASDGALEALARAALATGGPVQGIYLFGDAERPGESDGAPSISSLALLVKNLVRPLGLRRLGLPCLLNGSGSAYPFELLRHAPHGEGSIAEDYQLSIDLALRGHPTRFCAEAFVQSELPARRPNAKKQRTRWEHGHLALVFFTVPRLLLAGLGRPGLLALALDLAVPPLAFLALAWGLTAGLAAGVALTTDALFPLWVSGCSGALLFVSIVCAWLRFAGVSNTLSALVRVPVYVAWKVPLYLAFFKKREKRWTKTERDSEPLRR